MLLQRRCEQAASFLETLAGSRSEGCCRPAFQIRLLIQQLLTRGPARDDPWASRGYTLGSRADRVTEELVKFKAVCGGSSVRTQFNLSASRLVPYGHTHGGALKAPCFFALDKLLPHFFEW